MTIDEAIKALRTLRHPATDLERDLALTVVAHQVARALAYAEWVPQASTRDADDAAGDIAQLIAEGLDEHPEPQHLGTVSRRPPGAD